jgi:hypothetical protein
MSSGGFTARGAAHKTDRQSGNRKTWVSLGSISIFDIYFLAFFGRFSVRGAQKSPNNTAKNISGKIFDPVPFFVSDPPTHGVSDFFFFAVGGPLGNQEEVHLGCLCTAVQTHFNALHVFAHECGRFDLVIAKISTWH